MTTVETENEGTGKKLDMLTAEQKDIKPLIGVDQLREFI